MIALASWQPDAKALAAAEFCARHPHPVLVRCDTSSPLHPNEQTRGLTIDRVVIADRRGGTRPWSNTVGDYVAYEVRARHPERTADITIGCSSACDIQLDDTSVSKLHATLSATQAGWLVRDVSSLVGVRVNDFEPTEAPLASGDRITIGTVDLLFLMPREVHTLLRRLQSH